jgi:hypothetical protein
MRRACTAVAIVALAACAAPRLDTSSPESIQQSVKRLRESLPKDKQTKFDEAVMTVVTTKALEGGLVGLAALGAAGKKPEELAAQFLAPLNGKTADEIIAEADRIVAERKQKEREQALAEIRELELKRTNAESAKVELAKFEILKSRFRKVKTNQFLPPQPIIDLSVKNGTSKAVKRAFFVGTIASPGRSVPWLKEDFNYDISGGLEPGESADWHLSPNQFSEWGKVEPAADAVLTVVAVKLTGANDEVLYDATFSDEDQKRLDSLKKSAQ